ncbi:hypothetical protein [Niallia sp.]|nr:hypothetical protein [Niallia sp.]
MTESRGFQYLLFAHYQLNAAKWLGLHHAANASLTEIYKYLIVD